MIAPTPITTQRLLVIDDNPAIHEDFRKIFGTGGGSAQLDAAEAAFFGDAPPVAEPARYAIDSAFQGQEGLACVQAALVEQRGYPLAFVDVRMPPGWDGIETIARLWEADADLQVVICTAYSDYSWDEMIAKLGASDRLVILKKPFDNIEVLQLAQSLTAKWHLARQVRAQIRDLEKEVATRTAELRQSEAYFRVIAENVRDLVTVVDARGAHVFHNAAYERVLGIPTEELGRTAPVDLIHPDDQIRVVLATHGVLESGAAEEFIYRMRHQDGSWRMLKAQASPVRNPRGEVERLVIVARDISAPPQQEF